jgi:hypothetical protein
MMGKQIEIKWLPEPEEKDYPAAESYLSLLFENKTVKDVVRKLKVVPASQFNTDFLGGYNRQFRITLHLHLLLKLECQFGVVKPRQRLW